MMVTLFRNACGIVFYVAKIRMQYLIHSSIKMLKLRSTRNWFNQHNLFRLKIDIDTDTRIT